MQKLLIRSKLFIAFLLSLGLWLAWTSTNSPILEESTSSKKTVNVVSQPNHGSIWSTMQDELNLDHKDQSPQVKAEIRKLLADQDELYRILKAASPYIYFIYKQTRERGLPAELALIPVIESEFNPNDHSNKGATGLWQLMPGTARDLGVKVKSNYDGRRNVVASTRAALAYFNDLGNLFKGNWLLAIAAYNCGEGRVASAQRRAGSHSFWNLPLPTETKYYVPKLLAVAAIIKNPEKYGFQLPPISNEPYFAEVKVNKSVNLEKVAKTSGISVDTLHKLNPDLKNNIVPTSNKGTTTLLVPVKKVETVKTQLSENVVS